ncbi:hypothetical protein BKM07_26110 [Pseudomonas syringae group genomosp. 3]|uniref:Secreted protein n=1 Tax=Pseudomonas syringae group genomosp. 3 TaxID=251701 RepID=A0ABD6V4B7_9PSED|nr:hypothetical protein BKM07_26110 [Pseudomonas syringae group genomosp. 3]
MPVTLSTLVTPAESEVWPGSTSPPMVPAPGALVSNAEALALTPALCRVTEASWRVALEIWPTEPI